MAERRPNRVLGPGHDEFWAHCARGDLRLQRCRVCTHISWPATVECEKCGSDDLVWEPMSGHGSVISWCTFERSYYPELPVPWHAILVELDEGPLMISNPVGFQPPEMPDSVNVQFIDCVDDAGEFRLPVFAPERSS